MTDSAPSWSQLLSADRLNSALDQNADDRSPYQIDIDRLVFSGWFRRLQRKTQVHPLAENDHVRTRLTHTLEVASVGRSLGERAALHLSTSGIIDRGRVHDIATIVQAAAMAHDIGNPPFGHAGEYAINEWFERANDDHFPDLEEDQRQDLQRFEGNAQGFRVLTQIENNPPSAGVWKGGMRLTAATLGAFTKYPWTSSEIARKSPTKQKFGIYLSELEPFAAVAAATEVAPMGDRAWARHPLVSLVEAADDICYGLIDLEDGVELGLVSLDQVKRDVLGPLFEAAGVPKGLERRTGTPDRQHMSYLRTRAIGILVDAVAEQFVVNEHALRAGEIGSDGLIAACDPSIGTCVSAAKTMARSRVFSDKRKMRLEIGAYTTLEILLDAFSAAIRRLHHCEDPVKLPFKERRVLEIMGANAPTVDDGVYLGYRKALDYISGMTDHYASFMARQLSGG